MPPSSAFYQNVYRRNVAAEAEWLQIGAKAKADSVDLLTSTLSRPVDVLCEMGCGTGAVLAECRHRRLARSYIGVDSSKDALDWIRRSYGESIRLIYHDLDQGAPKLDVFADLVVISHVLEHLNQPEILLAGLRGKCACVMAEAPLENQPVPRGKAWVRSRLFGQARWDNQAGHVQFFSKASFRELLVRCGWKIIGERIYLAYGKHAILYATRKNGSPPWKSLAPYLLSKLLGHTLASHLLCVHYAVLAVPSRMP